MAASAAPLLKSNPVPSSSFLHDEEFCPLCEQQIPHDQIDEIKERIETRQKKAAEDVAARLQEQFSREKADAVDKANREGAAKAALAHEEGRKIAEASARETIAAAELASKEAQDLLLGRVTKAEAEKLNAEQMRVALEERLAQEQQERDAAIEVVRQEALAKQESIRAEAKIAAEAAANERIESAESARLKAEEAGKSLKDQLDNVTAQTEAKIAALTASAAEREIEIRSEAAASAAAATQSRLAELEQAKNDALVKAATAERQLVDHQAMLDQRLQEQREALEVARTAAVNAEKALAFEERLKLSAKVEELNRALEKKSNEELGEGAEIDLFEALKAEFGGDRIDRVNKGQPGADIIHVVVHNGKECGTIIYDSKNHGAWRNDFVSKLATDQMAAKAEHAILSTSKFPAGTRQLHYQDGVLLANPARVVTVVQLIRQHIVQTHILRMSGEEKTQKTAALYDFITSERCTDLIARFDTHTDDLLDIQVKEKKAHESVWKRQGELIRSVQKVKAELSNEIDMIIGTAGVSEQDNE